MTNGSSRKKLKNYKSASIRNKLQVQEILERQPSIQQHLPETRDFTLENLTKMCLNHRLLYVKPTYGSRGIGIFRIRAHEDVYVVRTTKVKKYMNNVQELYDFITSHSNRSLIIQQGIELDSVTSRPYDIRLMVQRKPSTPWECTGIFCKVGRPNNIVTNVFQGGELWTLPKLFKQKPIPKSLWRTRELQLKKLAILVAKALSSTKPGMYQMGIDVAFDEKMNPWILEVNSYHPAFYPMRRLNYAMFKKMMSYARSYGRKNP